MSTLRPHVSSLRDQPTVAIVLGGLVLLAWTNRFIQDDAFIAFRYAQNLAAGDGLLWNPGERPVAGYTTFLWTVVMSGLFLLGIEPVTGAWALGLVLCTGTLVVTWRLAGDLIAQRRDALLAMVLLGTNYTFSAWATGGMETQLQAFLVVSSTLLCFRASRPGPPTIAQSAGLSVLFGLLLMTRLDSAVVVGVLGTYMMVVLFRRPEVSLARRGMTALALVFPATVGVGTWLVWANSYYGDVLPNTYYVKLATATSVYGGLHYIYRFVAEYWLLPLGLLLLLIRPRPFVRALWGPEDQRVVVLVITLVAWGAYVVKTGGDFMEFRFLVPVLPLFMVWLWRGISIVVTDPTIRMAGVVVLAIGSGVHAATFRGSLFGIESIDGIAVHMREEGGAWDQVGRSLGRHFGGGDSDVSLAVAAAGAIPYFSGLPSIDMRGLNDEWVARHGHIVGNTPGHQRMAPFSYLVDRGVNLVVGHPQMSLSGRAAPEFLTADVLGRFGLVDATQETIPSDARFLVVPVGANLDVTVLYLTPHPRIDEAIVARGLTSIPLRRL